MIKHKLKMWLQKEKSWVQQNNAFEIQIVYNSE